MKIKFVIQPKVFGDETNNLITALQKNDVPYCLGIPDIIKIDEPIFVRGTIDFIQSFPSHNNKCKLTLENYTYTTYSQNYRFLFNKYYIVLPWHRLDITLVGKCFPNSEKYFIRPNSGKKIFTGTTLTGRYWYKELEIIKNLPSSSIKDDDLVVIAPYKKLLENEYRILMHENNIIDFSIYNEVNEERIELKTIQEFFKMWELPKGPDPYYTIDITGYNDPGSIEIIEINSCASAGWYDMDHDKIIKYIINN